MKAEANLGNITSILRSIGIIDGHGRIGPSLIFFLALWACGTSLCWTIRFAGLSSGGFGLIAAIYLSFRIVRSYWVDDPQLPLVFAFTLAICSATQVTAIGVALKANTPSLEFEASGAELLRSGQLSHTITFLLLIGPVFFGINHFGLPQIKPSVETE